MFSRLCNVADKSAAFGLCDIAAVASNELIALMINLMSFGIKFIYVCVCVCVKLIKSLRYSTQTNRK